VPSPFEGSHTLEDAPYSEYVKELQSSGFEIGYHGASMASSKRERSIRAFEHFHKILGFYPRIGANHTNNIENLYWGECRFTNPIFRYLYRFSHRGRTKPCQGHRKESEYFWGDLANEHICYLRSFTYNTVRLETITPHIVYRNPFIEWANYFFITSDANNVEDFNWLLHEKHQDLLASKGGVCIVSTHFGKGFTRDGSLNKRSRILLKRLSELNGWFVPVSKILDYILEQKTEAQLKIRTNWLDNFKLECKWFFHANQRNKNKRKYRKTELDYLSKSSL
jgi:hypothetical protein